MHLSKGKTICWFTKPTGCSFKTNASFLTDQPVFHQYGSHQIVVLLLFF